MLHDFQHQDFRLEDFPEEIQAHVKAKRYIDARKTESEKGMKVFRTKLLYAMPKKPLTDYPRADNVELRAMNLAGLYNRIHTFRAYNEDRRELLNAPDGATAQNLLDELGDFDESYAFDRNESDTNDNFHSNDDEGDAPVNVIVHRVENYQSDDDDDDDDDDDPLNVIVRRVEHYQSDHDSSL